MGATRLNDSREQDSLFTRPREHEAQDSLAHEAEPGKSPASRLGLGVAVICAGLCGAYIRCSMVTGRTHKVNVMELPIDGVMEEYSPFEPDQTVFHHDCSAVTEGGVVSVTKTAHSTNATQGPVLDGNAYTYAHAPSNPHVQVKSYTRANTMVR